MLVISVESSFSASGSNIEHILDDIGQLLRGLLEMEPFDREREIIAAICELKQANVELARS